MTVLRFEETVVYSKEVERKSRKRSRDWNFHLWVSTSKSLGSPALDNSVGFIAGNCRGVMKECQHRRELGRCCECIKADELTRGYSSISVSRLMPIRGERREKNDEHEDLRRKLMGTLQQQSILKGRQVNGNEEVELLHKLFSETARRHVDDIAIISEDANGEVREMTYKKLDKLTNRLARALGKYPEKVGIDGQPLVAVCMRPTERLPTILLSILKAGMAYLPLDPEFPLTRLKHILQEAEPMVVILEKEADISLYAGTLTKTYEELLDEARIESDDILEYEENSKQLAIVLYTSGSTGIPKGVLIRHSTILNRLNWQWRELPYWKEENRCIFKTALTFVDSVPEIWGPLLQGRTLVVVPREVTKNPERFVQSLEKHKIQRLVLVPSLLQSMLMYLKLQNKQNSLPSLKLWICSGETLSISLADQFFVTFHGNNRMLANFYGSTEIMGDVTYHIMRDRNDLRISEKVPIGNPLDNCMVYLVDKDMRLVPQGEIGELLVAGKNLAAGYLRDRESHRFMDNPHAIDPEYSRVFRTGDYAKIVKGTMVYEGRVDSQVKVRGHRVDLSEVEKIVSRMPEIDKAVVLCYKPGDLSQALLAFITVKKETKIGSREIEVILQKRMPLYMQPQVIIVNHIPLLTNGKTDRQMLFKQYESSKLVNENDEIANCDYTGVSEEDLAKAKVLFPTIATVIGASNRGTVNLDGNFYELGGNSLNSVYTVTKLRDQGYSIGITEFIMAKTLADVLRLLKINTKDDTLKENIDEEQRYFEMLNDSHKEHAIKIITESFYSKADLEQWLIDDISREDYRKLMEKLWEPLVEKDLSFVVKSSQDDRVIGVSLNFDLWDEPEVELDSKLTIVFDFLEYLEKPIRENKLPKGKGQIIHNFMMATHSDLVPAENVIIMGEMEEYCLRVARKKEYAGIFTTNTSPLTQQLAIDVYAYETMLTYRVNEYIAPDDSKPFGRAPDSQVAICSLKMID
ncbi:plipastatin synthase subunit B isoform X2 [Vespula squamosa]|uniref:Plipastatin synthase subunit B isoform X2 n=1 Tax=Vespula squamosa TaxID=30214 RepID=A0ABD2BF96_VESSQ